MSFKNVDGETMESYREAFMRGARRRGIPGETAEDVFEKIAAFAGYAFCKAHSASFALESFESAWWKAHYPAEFMAAVLSNGGGYYGYEEYLEEARRMDLELLPPCVNRSRARHRGCGRELRIGLMQVKGLTEATMEAIIERRPFSSLSDFLERVPASRREVESLIRCGAFACLGRTRPELMWELRVLTAAGGDDEAEGDVPSMLGRVPDIPDFDLRRGLEAERETLDMCVAAHPLRMFEERLEELYEKAGIVSSDELHDHDGDNVDLVGWRVTAKGTRTTDKGEEMVFVTFSDTRGRFEAIFFPKVYRRVAKELFRARGPYHIRGRVESDLGAVSVVAEDAELLIPGSGTPARTPA
jgi:error-prone DNA polymerase